MRWTEQEVEILRDVDLKHSELHELLPHRSIESIRRKSYQFNLQRSMRKSGHITPEEADSIWEQPEFRQLVEGHLLGDGCVDKEGYAFRFTNTCHTYVKHTQKKLIKLSNKPCKITHHPAKITHRLNGDVWNHQPIDTVACCCKHIFMPLRKKWYPDGTKIVPNDIGLSPLAVNRWYCDDGYISVLKSRSIYTVTLCTDNFSDDDIDRLQYLIKKTLGITTGTRMVHRKYRRIVMYSKATIQKFLNYIGKPPVNEMSYKWRVE